MNLQSTDFELFDIPARFAQDAAQLDARWKALQRQAHPDKFAAEGAAAQRVAMQWSARINEAYRRLKDPLRRAACLCELNGAPIQAESNTAMPAEFLRQQMAFREALEEAVNLTELDGVHDQATRLEHELLHNIAQQIDDRADFSAAAQSVRALMFLTRLADDIDRRREALA
jgi:molecular chaperone HscB